MGSHDEFLELCAVSTTGELTEEERKRLQAHLEVCAECRQALSEFGVVVDAGVPFLASELSAVGSAQGAPSSDGEAEAASPRDAPSLTERATAEREDAEERRGFIFAQRNGRRGARMDWRYVWMPLAAVVVLAASLGIYSYRVGRRQGLEVAQVATSSAKARFAAFEMQVSDLGHERHELKAELAERERMIKDLRRQIAQQAAAVENLKAVQADRERSSEADEAQKQQIADERNRLAQKVEAAQAALEHMQEELATLQQERSEGALRAASLEGRIQDLFAQAREREETIRNQEELLAHDRDIRELMGARDLYIAEVYDVAGDGKTRKPYGRVFYTKGKSLVFYAYDLDQQAGIKKAGTFQAWGRRGTDKRQALNLGIFYEDSVAKKRWVLKFDNLRTLEQIDAVFVTVEPHGGSEKPTGKRLLFAYLNVEPNHP